jgi:hypothetical protein
MRSQAAIDRQVRRKEQIDSQALLVTDAILTETIRRVRLVRPDADLSPLVKELKTLRTMRYKRRDAEAFSRDLLELAPEGDYVPRRPRPTRYRRRLVRRVFKVRPEALAEDAAAAVRIHDRALRQVRLMWLAERGRSEVKRQVGRGKGVDERLLVVTHAVLLESMRQTRSLNSSIGTPADDIVEPFEDMLAELQTLAYDHDEAERLATELANAPFDGAA